MKAIEDYRQFTAPAELHKAISTLRGMVAGISTDGLISEQEMAELTHWCSLHENLRGRHPFSELLPVIDRAISDGVIDSEERENILWLCGNFVDDCKYYDIITSSTQFLSGMIHGIMADNELSDAEISALQLWLNANDFLQGTYPFDELASIVTAIMKDKVVTVQEREKLTAFLSSVIEFKDSYNLSESDFVALREKYSIGGICAICPDISFSGKLFCFTGESYKCSRDEMREEIESWGGVFRDSVSNKTDYLVVGNAGNPCWAYSCYGRKVETAMAIRKAGGKVQIINETDFWDAVQDMEASDRG